MLHQREGGKCECRLDAMDEGKRRGAREGYEDRLTTGHLWAQLETFSTGGGEDDERG